MELPVTLVFEPPSQEELRALLRRRRTWVVAVVLALVIGVGLVVAGVSRVEAEATTGRVLVDVTSRPRGAAISIDGHRRGHTPTQFSIAPGVHRVQFTSDTTVDAEYTLDVSSEGGALDALLWRREPLLRRLRPSLPGATLDAVTPLTDGRLALVTRAAAGGELHTWRLDPAQGGVELLSVGVPGSRLTVTADGAHVAYIGRDVGPSAAGAGWFAASRTVNTSRSVVWQAPQDGGADAAPRAVWRAPAGEALHDVSWSPAHDSILGVTASELADGSVHSRLFKVVTHRWSDASALLSLPSAVVPGAYSWSPDGQHVVFAAHAGSLNALCLLSLDGTFRYLADLDASQTPPLPYLPVAWAADSRRVLFVAPRQQPSTPAQAWLGEAPRRALYLAHVDAPDPQLIAEVDAETPAWREDGRILLAARQRDDGALAILLLDDSGQPRPLVRVPLRVGPRYAAAWNTRAGQLLVADPTAAGTEFWLVSLALEHSP